jgi:hypothetical protein
MTYDLTWADETEKSWDQRNHAAHFCWAWGAMRWLMPVMRDLGMVFDVPKERRAVWPNPDVVHVDEWDEEDPAKWSPARTAYEAQAKVAAEARFEYPGIPEHKFSSNDPWRIWPDEIRSAVQQCQGKLSGYIWAEPWQRESFDRFLEFLVTSAEHGGVIAS